ncbi:hypothetical protein HDV00_006097 [Rhizophlyctis rosea]|nr:hypothetical protein HDV00_006097 [Rhizophlyctis rosea]
MASIAGSNPSHEEYTTPKEYTTPEPQVRCPPAPIDGRSTTASFDGVGLVDTLRAIQQDRSLTGEEKLAWMLEVARESVGGGEREKGGRVDVEVRGDTGPRPRKQVCREWGSGGVGSGRLEDGWGVGAGNETSFDDATVLHIFRLLNAKCLIYASIVCKRWNRITVKFANSLWWELCKSRWEVGLPRSIDVSTLDDEGDPTTHPNDPPPPPAPHASWKAMYITHHNIHHGRYEFISIHENFVMAKSGEGHGRESWRGGTVHGDLGRNIGVGSSPETENLTVAGRTGGRGPGPAGTVSPAVLTLTPTAAQNPPTTPVTTPTPTSPTLPPRRRYVMAWPEDHTDVYLIALDNSLLCWVEPTYPPPLTTSTTDNASASTSRSSSLEPPSYYMSKTILVRDLDDASGMVRSLKGHDEPISLILGNKEGTLISYDSASVIFVWDLRPGGGVVGPRRERVIQACEIHGGLIICMNIHARRIVTGGKNGRILVWSLDTGSVTHALSVLPTYIPQLSTHGTLNVALFNDRVAYGLYNGWFYVFELEAGNARAVEEEKEEKKMDGGGDGEKQKCDDTSIPQRSSSKSNTDSALPSNVGGAKEVMRLRDTEVQGHGFTYAPMTMTMGEWFLVTNGAFPDELSVWEIGGSAVKEERKVREGRVLVAGRLRRSAGSLRGGVSGERRGEGEGSANGSGGETTTVLTRTRPRRYALSETYALQRKGYYVPPFRDLRSAEIMNDGTGFVASVMGPLNSLMVERDLGRGAVGGRDAQGGMCLFGWDFRGERRQDRWVVRVELEEGGEGGESGGKGKACWVCFDDVGDEERRIVGGGGRREVGKKVVVDAEVPPEWRWRDKGKGKAVA